jgi:hypothetical protein
MELATAVLFAPSIAATIAAEMVHTSDSDCMAAGTSIGGVSAESRTVGAGRKSVCDSEEAGGVTIQAGSTGSIRSVKD